MTLSIHSALISIASVAVLVASPNTSCAQLRAGTARIEITPSPTDLPKPFTSIESALYVRALLLEAHGTRIVFVDSDLPTIASSVFNDLTRRIAETAQTAPENILLSVTHTHNAVRLDNEAGSAAIPGSAAIAKITADKIVESVHQAVADMRPARSGYATGIFHLAIGRQDNTNQQSDPTTTPVVERSIGVFKVETLDGEPMALVINSGPEPTMMAGMNNKISADVAGVTERYVERRLGGKVVALYTVGSPSATALMGGQPIRGISAADPEELMKAVGTVLGEDVLATSARVVTNSELSLAGAVQVLTCPGKTTTPINNGQTCSDAPESKLPKCVFSDHDAPPVKLRVGVVRLGDLSIVDADANIEASIWAKVRDQAPPSTKTMLMALVFGPMHYVEPDAEYPSNSYAVTASTAKPGCAEKGFLDAALTMLKKAAADGIR